MHALVPCIVQLFGVLAMPPGTLNLLQLDDGVLACVLSQLRVADPLARRTLMLGARGRSEHSAGLMRRPRQVAAAAAAAAA